MSKITEAPERKLTELGEAIDEFLAHAQKVLPKDRFAAVHGTSQKLQATAVRFGIQLGMLLDQFDRLNVPPKGPRGPATIHTLRPPRRR